MHSLSLAFVLALNVALGRSRSLLVALALALSVSDQHSGELFSASVHNSVSLDFRAKLEEKCIFTDLDRSYDDFSSENRFFYFIFLCGIDKKPQMAGRIVRSRYLIGIFYFF